MRRQDATVGTRVRTDVEFPGVPRYTEGVIDEDYDTGIMVAWNLPDRPLPPGYRAHAGQGYMKTGILRDGFSKDRELHYLEVVT